MSLNRALFSSADGTWRTPEEIHSYLEMEFLFDFDPCPESPLFDGLSISWGNCNFVNPPYGGGISEWSKKGFNESLKGKTVVFLIPSRTDTQWWHDYIMKADEFRFIRGRLKFKGAKYGAPFPSAIAIFRGRKAA